MTSTCKVHGKTNHYAVKDRPSLRCMKCNTERVRRHRQKNKLWCVDYLGGECVRCGYNRCVWALEFHHRDPAAKEFQLSKYVNASKAKLMVELAKCDLLCSNCHREEHGELTESGNRTRL